NITVPDQTRLTLDVFLRADDVYIYGIRNREPVRIQDGLQERETEFYFADAHLPPEIPSMHRRPSDGQRPDDVPAEIPMHRRPPSDGQRPKPQRRVLGFSGPYIDLGSYANLSINRGTITAALTQLAHWHLTQEISNRDNERRQPTSEARHLLLLILMIS